VIDVESNEAFFRLSRAIQDRKVILWAGAGLSSDAGYPTGTDLANLMLERLGEPQGADEKLPSVAERFKTEKGREALEQLLKEIFSEGRESRIHQQIAAINRFPYIITTNYDPLFEDAFGDDLLVIRNQSELSSTATAREKTILYKIHGDARQPETIVITESDYRKLDKSSLMWEALRTRLAEYSILFVGYSLRDKNTTKHLKTVLTRLGEHANPYYLIDLKTDGILPKDLHKASIELILLSAKEAFERLYDYIRDTPILELTTTKALEINDRLFDIHGIKASCRASSDGSLDSVVITGKDEMEPADLRVNFNPNLPPDSDLGRQYYGLIAGEHFEDVEIGREYKPELEAWINGLRILPRERFLAVTVSREPDEEYLADLQMVHDPEVRLTGILVKFFRSRTHFKFEIADPRFSLGLSSARVTQSGSYPTTVILKFVTLIPNIQKAKAIFSLLDSWYQGNEIVVIPHDGRSPFKLPRFTTQSKGKTSQTVRSLRILYSDLDCIERIACVKFKLSNEISTTDQHHIGMLAALYRGEKRPIETISATLNRINRDAFREMTHRTLGHLRVTGNEGEGATILDKQISIPYVVEGRLVDLANYDEVMARFNEGGEEIPFQIERGQGELYMRYDPSRSLVRGPTRDSSIEKA
jgi:hypothetical protein